MLGAMKTILVPLDFSGVSEKTAAAALALVQDIHVNVVFLHVEQKGPDRRARIDREPVAVWSDPEIEERMRGIVRRARDQGIIATSRVARGSPAEEILQQAGALDADLIVMGSHHYDKIEGTTVGSTFQEVLRKARCPLMLVPGGGETDGAEHGKSLLEASG